MQSTRQNFCKIFKRPFLLLEVLIALALVALTLFPIISVPLLLIRSEMQFQEKIEGRLVIQNSFTDIALLLYKNKISFEELLIEKERLLPSQNGFTVRYVLRKPKIKKLNDSPRYLLFPVEITVQKGTGDAITETFELFVEKRSHED